MKCNNCGFADNGDYQFCRKCTTNLYGESNNKRVRPLTDWESMKLSFYRDEKKWHENIRNRQIIDGKPYMTDGRGNIKGELPNVRR